MRSSQKNTTLPSDLPPIGLLSDCFSDGERHILSESGERFFSAPRKLPQDAASKEEGAVPYIDYHYHEGVELFFVTDGRAELLLGGKILTLDRGDIACISPFCAHGIYLKNAENAVFSRTVVAFHPYRIFPDEGGDGKLFKELKALGFEEHIPPSHPANAALWEVAEHLKTLFAEHPTGWAVRAYAELMRIYAIIAEHRLWRAEPAENTHMFTFMRQVEDYIETHLDEDISTGEVAASFRYTDEHFCRMFKKCYGKTFKDYLNGYRIRRAKELIEGGDFETLAQISGKCGFNNQNHFSAMFKKYAGVLPSEYLAARKPDTEDPQKAE